MAKKYDLLKIKRYPRVTETEVLETGLTRIEARRRIEELFLNNAFPWIIFEMPESNGDRVKGHVSEKEVLLFGM